MAKNSDTHLKPLSGAIKRSPFLVLDIESKDGPTQNKGFTRPFLVGLYDGTSYFGFRDTPSAGAWDEVYWHAGGCVDRVMREILTKEYAGHTIYAHNAGRFDYLHILSWLMANAKQEGLTFEIVPSMSSILVLDVYKQGGKDNHKRDRWRFLDSVRLFPMKLQTIAKSFGLEGKSDIDLDLHESSTSWEAYNHRDCEQLYLVLQQFHAYIEDTLGGEVGVTAPATAMKTFRRKYLQAPVPRVISTHEFVREAYFGGRVEDYVRKANHLHYYDFNSSYPAAMLEDMPASTARVWTGPPRSALTDGVGFCECDVYIPPECKCPPLPVRLEGKLCFPVGKLRGTWDSHELALVEECGGYIARWGKSVWFAGKPLFRSMVEDLYPYRDKSSTKYDAALAAVVKILLNSLYGKFGTKPEKKKIHIGDEEPPEGAKPANPTDPDCAVWYSEEAIDAPYMIPQIAAHVTALARVRLWRVMHDIFESGSFVAYCDTDSILTPKKLESSNALGRLKDEYPGHTFEGELIAPKVYVLRSEQDVTKTVHKAKGLRGATLEQVLAFASGATLEFETLEKIGMLARDSFRHTPKMIKTTRSLQPTSGKRERVGTNETRPHNIVMW